MCVCWGGLDAFTPLESELFLKSLVLGQTSEPLGDITFSRVKSDHKVRKLR